MRPGLLFLLAWALLMFTGACAALPTEEQDTRAPSAPPPTEPQRAALPILRKVAPELTNQTWFNADKPLRLADLRGQVVLVDFWTFDCYNCLNVLPYLKAWHRQYNQAGLTVIGVHSPEFDHEREMANVKAAIQRLDIPYPVTLDNDFTTWRAYSNRYWPTFYLVDKRGQIRYTQIGEGQYDRTEAAIQALLAEGT